MSPRAGVHAAGAVTTSPGLTKRVMITARLAGATAWAGSELARGIAGALDVSLVAAIACRDAGRALGEALDEPRLTARIHATAAEALAAHPPGVLVEYTRPVVAKDWVLHAPTTDSRSVSRQFHTATSIHVAPFTRTDRLVAGESRRAFDRAGGLASTSVFGIGSTSHGTTSRRMRRPLAGRRASGTRMTVQECRASVDAG